MSRTPQGLFVPLVTPFHADESIDFDAYKKIIDYTIENGMDGVLIAGSTGEYHMMTQEEKRELIKKGCEIVAGRVPIVAGTGETTAKATIETTNFAADCGAEWGLVLPPYYQQTTEEGVYDFFKEVAEGSKIGIIIYYNPISTGVEMTPELLYRLGQLDKIVAVKETVDERHTCQVQAMIQDLPNFIFMEAEEHLLLPSYSIGCTAAFSIIFNLLPREMKEIYTAAVVNNDFATARKLNSKYFAFYDMMEAEPYPGPVKAGLDAIGLPGGIVRKPLTQPTDAMRARMREELTKLGYKVK